MLSHIHSPDQVLIIGGGRWARVIADVVCELLPTHTPIKLCSPRAADTLASWSEERGLSGRIVVGKKLPEIFPGSRTAVIVANAACDHMRAGLWALERGASVLIEKPLTLSLRDAETLADCASRHASFLAAAHVLRFTDYLINFSRMLPDWNSIISINLEWVDSAVERRYGETKQYDSSVPVFADCLPHAVSVLQTVFGLLPELAGPPTVEDGGSKVFLPLMLHGRPCSFYMQRNGLSRLRRMSVKTSNGLFILDFSIEPGVIQMGKKSICADSYWDHTKRPLALLLSSFLIAAAGESVDSRLSLDVAFTSCAITDSVMPEYRAAMLTWLSDRLSYGNELNADIRYALVELLQAGQRLPKIELEETEVLLEQFLRDS